MRKGFAILFFVILVGVWVFENFAAPREIENQMSAEVLDAEVALAPFELVSVVDGDTIRVRVDGEIESVRLIGVDAPETRYSQKGEECYGDESSEALRSLLPHDTVLLQFDPSQGERDTYDRLLAYVFDPNGLHISETMIREGYAEEYTFKGRAYLHQALFREAEQFARTRGAGLWSACKD